jgi:HlyD family secretion protein
MKKAIRIFIIILFVGLFGGTLYFLYLKSKPVVVVYKTTIPKITSIVKKTVATGAVSPRKEIEIKPQVSGIIEQVFIEAGNMIKKGDVIAKVKIIPNMVSLNEAESRLNRANISLEDSKLVYERQKVLFDKKVIAVGEFQQYETAFRNARESVSAANDNLHLVREGATGKTAKTGNTMITSTIDGMVLTVPIEVGNSVIESNTFNAGTTVATIADMGEMIFKGKVDESEVGKLHEGMPLILTIGAIDSVKFDAKLEHISPKGVAENGAIQFEIKAAVNLKKNNFIRAGYSANADIVLERRDKVMTIPESLIQFEGAKTFIEIETTPQKFIKRYIKTGLSDGLNIEVVSGLKMKEKIKTIEPLVEKPA